MIFYKDNSEKVPGGAKSFSSKVMSALLFQCIGVPAVTLIFAWLCMYFGLSDTYSYFPVVSTQKLYDIDSNIGIQSQFWSIANVSRILAMFWFDEQTWSYVTFILAILPLIVYAVAIVVISICHIGGHFHFHKKEEQLLPHDCLPGISIVKPLMGVDDLLEENLESHFSLTYPKFELLLCTQTDDDEAIPVVNKLRKKYPHVDCTLFTGGGPGCVNPMVNNMAPGYWNAKYDFIWVSTSRIKASSDIIMDMSCKLQKPKVGLVHQMPFYTDLPGFAGTIDKVHFGCIIGRCYPAFNFLGLCCCTGMSYLFKKPVLEECMPQGGLIYFGKYLAEDFFLCTLLHEKGYKLVMSAYPAQQNIPSSSICFYKDRMVRWLRLRLNMMTFTSGVLEPLGDMIPLGILVSLSVNHFFNISVCYFLLFHFTLCLTSDYILLKRYQNGPLIFSKWKFVFCWFVTELMRTVTYFEAIWRPQTIFWGTKQFRVRLGGVTEVVRDTDKTKS